MILPAVNVLVPPSDRTRADARFSRSLAPVLAALPDPAMGIGVHSSKELAEIVFRQARLGEDRLERAARKISCVHRNRHTDTPR